MTVTTDNRQTTPEAPEWLNLDVIIPPRVQAQISEAVSTVKAAGEAVEEVARVAFRASAAYEAARRGVDLPGDEVPEIVCEVSGMTRLLGELSRLVALLELGGGDRWNDGVGPVPEWAAEDKALAYMAAVNSYCDEAAS